MFRFAVENEICVQITQDKTKLDHSYHYSSGEPGVKLTGVNKDVPVRIEPTGPDQYRCTYTPTEPGAYLLDITWNQRPLKCCPFKINVNQPVYAHKVSVSGDPLKSGTVGRDIRVQIDPRNAGSGT